MGLAQVKPKKNHPGLGRFMWHLCMTKVSENESSMREEWRTRSLKRTWWWHNKQSDREWMQSGGNHLAAGLVWKHCPCPCAKKQCHNKVKEYCLFKRKGGQSAALWRRETRKEEWSNQRQWSQYKHPHYRWSLRHCFLTNKNMSWCYFSHGIQKDKEHLLCPFYKVLILFLESTRIRFLPQTVGWKCQDLH